MKQRGVFKLGLLLIEKRASHFGQRTNVDPQTCRRKKGGITTHGFEVQHQRLLWMVSGWKKRQAPFGGFTCCSQAPKAPEVSSAALAIALQGWTSSWGTSFQQRPKLKNLFGQFGVLHPLHPQCGCSSVKMCEQRTWTVCCFLLGPKPITLESIGYQP